MEALPDVVAASLKQKLGFAVPVAAIAGPCIAGELAVRRPTGTVIVSHDFGLALQLCDALQTEYYQPRASLDVIGAEICARPVIIREIFAPYIFPEIFRKIFRSGLA